MRVPLWSCRARDANGMAANARNDDGPRGSRKKQKPRGVRWGDKRVTPILRPTNSYGLVLGLLVVTFILEMASDDQWARALTAVLTLATVTSALLTSRVQRRVLVIIVALGLTAFALQIAAHLTDTPEVRGLGTLLNAAMLSMLPVVILVRVFRHPRVTGETILGLVSVYFSLGIVFALLFQGLDGIQQSQFFAQIEHPQTADFLYFSFVTLTTLGFGDLTPIQGLGRALTVLEALIGQVFLVTVVARGVSLMGFAATGRPANLAEEPPDGSGDDL